MKAMLLLSCVSALFFLQGCSVERIEIVKAEAEGIVTVPENPATVVAQSETVQVVEAVFPWKSVVDMLGTALPYFGQTRRKAMQERVNYEERRSFSLFSIIYKAGECEGKDDGQVQNNKRE